MPVKIDKRTSYFKMINYDHKRWCTRMTRRPSLINRATRRVQQRINRIIPEKVHQVITKAIKEITRGVLTGAKFTTFKRQKLKSIEEMEALASKKITIYSSSSAAEGAITGFGGFLSSMADFPLWLTLKMKMLFEIASAYGIDIKDYKERIYILHIFQLTFSSQKHRNAIFKAMRDWESTRVDLPEDINEFDWRTFQLEYRDFIDLAKLVQMIPGVGAVAGAFVNHRYTRKLGENAKNAYRLRMKEFKNISALTK